MDYYSYTPYYKPKHIFKYPKFLSLAIIWIAVYFILQGTTFSKLHAAIISTGYIGVFVAGMLYSYGFTAAPATAMLLVFGDSQNIFLAALIGGIGAMLTDLAIFTFIRVSFKDEIKRFEHERWLLYISHKMPKWLKKIIVPSIAGAMIASPIPDEIGVTMMASYRKFSYISFTILTFILDVTGVFTVLWIGKNLLIG